jgi:hypothetical protein
MELREQEPETRTQNLGSLKWQNTLIENTVDRRKNYL